VHGAAAVQVGSTHATATAFATVSVSDVGTPSAPDYQGSASITAGGTSFGSAGDYQVLGGYRKQRRPGWERRSATVTVTPRPDGDDYERRHDAGPRREFNYVVTVAFGRRRDCEAVRNDRGVTTEVDSEPAD
jgi:hypothetical protein